MKVNDNLDKPTCPIHVVGTSVRQHAPRRACNINRATNATSMGSLTEIHAAVAQLAARRSHNPKVGSSVLSCRNERMTQPNS